MNSIILILLSITLCTKSTSICAEKAVICVPIADLLGQSMHTKYPDQSVNNSYDMLPVCYKTNANYACPRVHQLLYNDIVDVISQQNDEVCVTITHVFYTTHSSQAPQTTYWTASKNVRLLSELTNKKLSIQRFPEPINFQNYKLTESNNYPTICLTHPHYDKKTNLTFSAGTRFVVKRPKKQLKNREVYAIDYSRNKEVCISIPTHKCYINDTINPEKQIKQYVLLLKSWANQNDSFIPYVWGGTTFIDTLNTPFKDVTKKTHNNIEYSFYEYENHESSPKSGFDCSGLISRATQTCNIPYFCKNTTTIGQHLQPLQLEDQLIDGDLILVKGHVMIVSDYAKNLLIEARGYGHGYGKVHEIELHKVFDGIETYDDLRKAFFEKKALKRKDCNGKIRDTFNDWKLLKIMSVYT